MTDPDPRSDPGTAAPPASMPRPPHDQGDLWADDGTSRAEVQVEGDRMEVTLPLPDIDPAVLEHFVGSNLLLLWSNDDPERQRTLVRLPSDVRPETSVTRFTNGVFDLTVLLARPDTDPPRADPHRPDPAQDETLPPDGSA